MIGTLGGIPEKMDDYKTMLVNSQASGGSKNNEPPKPDTDNDGKPEEQKKEPEKKPDIQRPGNMSISKTGERWMQDNEGLASLSHNKIKLGSSNTPGKETIYAYADSGGTWTGNGRCIQTGYRDPYDL